MDTSEQRSFSALNKAYFGALRSLGLFFERSALRRVNGSVRWSLVTVVLPALEELVRKRFDLGPEFRLQSRHSVNRTADYNVFFSDLDMSAVLPEAKLPLAADISFFLLRLKSTLPFLGEIETYSVDEMAAIEAPLAKAGGLHRFLRDVRKLTWIEGDERRHKTDYHRLKFERSVRKVLAKNGVSEDVRSQNNVAACESSIRDQLSRLNLPADVEPISFCVFSRYLNFAVQQGEGESPPGNVVQFESPYGLWLLALTPFEADTPGLAAALSKLRQNSVVREQWKALLVIEAITMAGVYRARPDLFSWIPEWRQQLENWLPKSD